MPQADANVIAVVDDDASLCQALGRLLGAAGFNAAIFPSGETLLGSGIGESAACFVLDINLPGMTGFDLADRLKELRGSDVPVVFITAYNQPANVTEANARHSVGCLTKPFPAADLIAAVRNASAFKA
jgi:FixJ family two-component response regulator